MTIAASRLKYRGGALLRATLIVAMVCCCGYPALAKQKLKKKTTASSKKTSKKPVSLNEIPLKSENYPAEISSRIAAYNVQVNDINAVRKKDPKLAKARGDVLKIQKEIFENYTSFMASMNGREADKIRKTVATGAWYKGMPQVAFIASMGLPDDVQTTPVQDGSRLKLIYKSTSFTFEKGRLRSYDNAGS
jgi:hypothetical protein